MVKDKNGTEIKIGDTVHYKRPESTHEYDYGDGRTKTVTIRARDEVFTVTELNTHTINTTTEYQRIEYGLLVLGWILLILGLGTLYHH